MSWPSPPELTFSTPGAIQQSPSRPPEGCPCHRQLHLQCPARLSIAGPAQTCWLLVQGTKLIWPSVEHLGEGVYHGLRVLTWAPGWGPGGWGSLLQTLETLPADPIPTTAAGLESPQPSRGQTRSNCRESEGLGPGQSHTWGSVFRKAPHLV